MFDYAAHAWTVPIIFPHCLSGDSATGGNSARCRQPPSAPYCAAAPSMTNRPPPIVRLSDDEDGDVVDTFGGNKLAIGGRDGLGNTVGGPVFDLPLGPQHAWPALLQKKQSVAQKKLAAVHKRPMAVPKVELEPEQDTAVVDNSRLLPEQPKKRCKDTSVVSAAGNPPADIRGAYCIMKYDRHGKDCTYAVRLKGGSQFTEINICRTERWRK